MRLVLLGLPGAGKGTQGDRLSQKYSVPHISTGSIFRAAIDAGSELGIEANKYISKGFLIPDELAIDIVEQRLLQLDCNGGWILDGFPRTVQQAIHLDAKLEKSRMAIEYAIDIRISEDEAIKRIAERRICSECGSTYHLTYYRAKGRGVCDNCGGRLYQRSDDNEMTAKERLRVYLKQTHPVIHYYAQRGKLYSVNGERAIDEVFADIETYVLKQARKNVTGEKL
jgi:adenylate kinase